MTKKEQMQTLIRTALVHEHSFKEKGSRFWLAAELLSTTWFVAETCTTVADKNEIQQWVTLSIERAVLIQRALEPINWARIFICMRAPVSIRNATLFEVVREVYRSDTRNRYVFMLENGLSFSTKSGTESERHNGDEPDKLELIYSQPR